MDPKVRERLNGIRNRMANMPQENNLVVSQEEAQFLKSQGDIYKDVATNGDHMFYNKFIFNINRNTFRNPFSNPFHPTYTVSWELEYHQDFLGSYFTGQRKGFPKIIVNDFVDAKDIDAIRNVLRDEYNLEHQGEAWRAFESIIVSGWCEELDLKHDELSPNDLSKHLQDFLNKQSEFSIGCENRTHKYSVVNMDRNLPTEPKELMKFLEGSIHFQLTDFALTDCDLPNPDLLTRVIDIKIDGKEIMKACERHIPDIMERMNNPESKDVQKPEIDQRVQEIFQNVKTIPRKDIYFVDKLDPGMILSIANAEKGKYQYRGSQNEDIDEESLYRHNEAAKWNNQIKSALREKDLTLAMNTLLHPEIYGYDELSPVYIASKEFEGCDVSRENLSCVVTNGQAGFIYRNGGYRSSHIIPTTGFSLVKEFKVPEPENVKEENVTKSTPIQVKDIGFENTDQRLSFADGQVQKHLMVQDFQKAHPDLVIGSAKIVGDDFVAFDENGVAIAVGLDERLYTESELSEHIAQLEQLVEQEDPDLESEDPDIDDPR